MASNDFPALARAWRGGDEPATALLAQLRNALGAAAAAVYVGPDASAPPRWQDPVDAPAAVGPEWPLRDGEELLGHLRLVPAADAPIWTAEQHELADFAALLLAQGLARDAL